MIAARKCICGLALLATLSAVGACNVLPPELNEIVQQITQQGLGGLPDLIGQPQEPPPPPPEYRVPDNAVRLLLTNEAGVPVRADVVFRQGELEVRRTSRYLPENGMASSSQILPTLADTLTIEAREAEPLNNTRPGDLLAQVTLVFGVDFQGGQTLSFVIHPQVIDVDDPPVVNIAPVGPASTGSTVTVDASGSFDPEGNPLTFNWLQTGGPAVALNGAGGPTATFVAPAGAPTQVSFEVTVSDGALQSTGSITVDIVPGNQPPIPNAGPDQMVASGVTVMLDGSGSSDPEGDALLFQWMQLAGPAVALDAPQSVGPRFVAPAVAEDQVVQITMRLIVTESGGAGNSASDDMVVTVFKPDPLSLTVSADPPTILQGGSSQLTAEVTGGVAPFTFAWTVEVTPHGNPGVVFPQNTATTTWTPPGNEFGTWQIAVTVTDAAGQAASGNTTVGVIPDCNTSGLPDDAEVAAGTAADCNTSGLPDECDVAGGSSPDFNETGIPDECEPQDAVILLDSNLIGLNRTVDGVVRLLRPAGPGDQVVSLESLQPGIATIAPAMVTIPEGEQEAAITVTGQSVGMATLRSFGMGLVDFNREVVVTDAIISLAPNLTVAPGQTASLALSLTRPAGPGGVTIHLTSSDPSVLTVTESVFIAEGLQVPAANPQVNGLMIGGSEVTATAIGFAPDTKLVLCTVFLNFEPSFISVPVGVTKELRLRMSSPVDGLVIDVTSDNAMVATAVQSMLTTEPCKTCLTVQVTAVASGNTVIRASSPGVNTATANINVIATPTITISNMNVGDDLQAIPFNRFLGAPAPAGNLDLTLTSNDPSRLLLSDDPTVQGSAVLHLTVQAGSSFIPAFYLQALQDNGTVFVTAEAAGYQTSQFTATLKPSGIYISSPGSFNTTTISDDTFIRFHAARLEPSGQTFFVQEAQAVRGGLDVTFDLTNSDDLVGTLADSQLTINGGEVSTTTFFTPLAEGMTTINLVQPEGFESANFGQTIVATVATPQIFVSNLQVGEDLQTPSYYYFVQLEAPAPPGGVDLTLTALGMPDPMDPNSAILPPPLRLSTDSNVLGTEMLVLHVDEGNIYPPTYFVQALNDVDGFGSVEVEVSAPGYAGASYFVDIHPSGFYISSPGDFSTSPTSPPQSINIRAARLSPGSLFVQENQALRPGLGPVSVDVTSSTADVGTITTSPVVFNTNTFSVNTSFQPLAVGMTNIAVGTPPDFDTPVHLTEITAVVATPGMIFNNASVGDDLQTILSSFSRRLAAPAPPGGVDVTLTSTDPDKLLLSADPLLEGSAQIVLNVPAGSVQIPNFYLQGVDSTGSANVVATAPGYLNGMFTVSLFPSGFYFQSSGVSTTTFSPPTGISIRSARLHGTNLSILENQVLRGGITPVDIDVMSSANNVGFITMSPVTFGPNVGFASTSFDPEAAGSALITMSTPTDFDVPASNQQMTATVGAPNINLQDTTVGLDLQQAVNVFLQVAPPSPVTVTLTTCSDEVATISTDPFVAGSTSVTIENVTSTFAGTIYVQGRQIGCTTIKAVAAGFNDRIANVTVDPSGFYIAFPGSFTTELGADETPIQIRSARLDLTTLNVAVTQPVRGGLTVNVNVVSSNTGVGTITVSPLSFGPDVFFAQTTFNPVGAGMTQVSVNTPAGFTTPSNLQSIDVTVDDPGE